VSVSSVALAVHLLSVRVGYEHTTRERECVEGAEKGPEPHLVSQIALELEQRILCWLRASDLGFAPLEACNQQVPE
jgi:hypothetical protein